MSYSALCFLKSYPQSSKDLKEAFRQSPVSEWTVTSKYGIFTLAKDEFKFFIAIDDYAKLEMFSADDAAAALHKAGRAQDIPLVRENKNVLKLWSTLPDPDMDYFNDYLFILEAIEEKFGGVVWDWRAKNLI